MQDLWPYARDVEKVNATDSIRSGLDWTSSSHSIRHGVVNTQPSHGGRHISTKSL
jgi:hypothetical protein